VSERTALRSERVLVDGGLQPATVMIEDGLVAGTDVTTADATDLGDLVLMPALVDSHVHVNEPGRTEWEGFETATRAAAAGGVAMIIDMPLNSIPPTTTVEALQAKQAAAASKATVDIGFWGGIVPGSLEHAGPLADAGVFGFKSFLVPSGVDEFPCIGLGDLDPTLEALADLGLPLIVHAEAPGPIEAAPQSGVDHSSYLASRPPEAEVEAIEAVITAVRRTGGAAHILHLSAAEALPSLAAARFEGLSVTVETCPHYLALAADEIPPDACEFKCAPPIRDAVNRDLLWQALADGVIDMVVSDHSPCPGEMKEGGFDRAWGGIASLELRLPVVWTEAVRRGHTIPEVAEWLCAAPARLAGLPTGTVEPGMRADLVAWDPDALVTVDPAALHQRHPVSPYAGRTLRGVVRSTWVRGKMVFDGAGFSGPHGRLLERT
jgi:allantoinase